jgi:hypothetical protein
VLPSSTRMNSHSPAICRGRVQPPVKLGKDLLVLHRDHKRDVGFGGS